MNNIFEEYKELLITKRNKDFDECLLLLKAIIDDLPQNRDWLNPDIEHAAKELLKEYKRL
jgi:hypothetical protein